MDREQTLLQLDKIAKDIIKQSRANLTRSKITAQGKLYRSLQSNLQVFKNSIAIEILMEHYGNYVDQGVSGTERKFDTPFSYRDKMPPVSVFSSWMVKRGIAPRNEKGHFLSRRSMQFAIAKSIQKRGLRPTRFYTNAVESAMKRIPDEIAEAYALDLEFFIKQNLQNLKKLKK